MRTARILAAFLTLSLAGCRPTIDYPDVYADLSCETAYVAVRARGVMPPSPAPAADKCENCDGTGKVGDSTRIVMTCPVCRGTGKKVKSVLVPAKAPACKDGSCYR